MRARYLSTSYFFALLLAYASAGAASQPAGNSSVAGKAGPSEASALVKVNGAVISDDLLNLLASSRAQGPLSATSFSRQQLLDDLITTELLAQAAEAEGVHQQRQHQLELMLAHKTLLSQLYVQQYIQSLPISEQDLRARYDAVPERVMIQMQRWDFPSEQAALAFLAHVNVQQDDAQLADGVMEPWQPLDEFAPAAQYPMHDLQPGDWLPGPVPAANSWQVWQLAERSVIRKPTFEQAKEGIRQELGQRHLHAHILALREQAKVEMLTEAP